MPSEMTTDYQEPRFDALLSFLPEFESQAVGGTVDMSSFATACYEHGWVAQFDWTRWQDEAEQLVQCPDEIGASYETIRRLLTTHVRKDRFCEGHLEAVYRSGHTTAILRRLADIST